MENTSQVEEAAPVTEAPAETQMAPGYDTVKPRASFTGKVTRTDLGGAFVDLGQGVEGYIHISQFLEKGAITRVADAVKPGDEMTVFVMSVNPTTKRITLTQHRPPALDWPDLEVGLKLTDARVVAVESFGAFVDIDGPKHALLPFNLMADRDRPKVGQVLETVWVMEADEAKRRIGVTMIEPPMLPWEKIHRGDKLQGTVVRIERNGAFVDVGAERDGLISSKSLGSGWVNVGDFVEVGELVEVKVVGVDPSRKRLDLALDGMKAEDYSLSSGPDEVISPMAAAMQKARQGARQAAQAEAARGASLKLKKQLEQQEALNRTLQHMQATGKK